MILFGSVGRNIFSNSIRKEIISGGIMGLLPLKQRCEFEKLKTESLKVVFCSSIMYFPGKLSLPQ